jgi:hypothetical protein
MKQTLKRMHARSRSVSFPRHYAEIDDHPIRPHMDMVVGNGAADHPITGVTAADHATRRITMSSFVDVLTAVCRRRHKISPFCLQKKTSTSGLSNK